MAGAGHVLEAAPAVGDFLVLGERVGDQRERAQIGLEGLGQRLRRAFSLLAVRVLQHVERKLDRERLAADAEAQRRDGLVVIAVPGRIAGHRFFVEQFLDPVLELIGLFLAYVLDPGPVMAERGVGHGGVECGVVDAVELEGEEQHMQRSGGDAFLRVAVEFGANRVGGIAGVIQRRIGHDAAERVVERLIAFDRRGQRLAGIRPRRQHGELALELGLEGNTARLGILQVPFEFGAVEAGIEVAQVPFRQRAELGGFFRFFSGFGHEAGIPWRGQTGGRASSRPARVAMRWRRAAFHHIARPGRI